MKLRQNTINNKILYVTGTVDELVAAFPETFQIRDEDILNIEQFKGNQLITRTVTKYQLYFNGTEYFSALDIHHQNFTFDITLYDDPDFPGHKQLLEELGQYLEELV